MGPMSRSMAPTNFREIFEQLERNGGSKVLCWVFKVCCRDSSCGACLSVPRRQSSPHCLAVQTQARADRLMGPGNAGPAQSTAIFESKLDPKIQVQVMYTPAFLTRRFTDLTCGPALFGSPDKTKRVLFVLPVFQCGIFKGFHWQVLDFSVLTRPQLGNFITGELRGIHAFFCARGVEFLF